MRQTELTLNELVSIASRKTSSSYPFCLIINEIGEIFTDSEKEEEKITAENTLVKTLSDCSISARQIALSFLLLKEPRQENKQIIRDYISKNPDDAAVARRNLIENEMEPWFIF